MLANERCILNLISDSYYFPLEIRKSTFVNFDLISSTDLKTLSEIGNFWYLSYATEVNFE